MLPLRCFTFKPLLLAKTFITIYNNTSSSDKSISCCLSHQHPATYLFRAVLACKRCLICADFLPDQTRSLFHWRKHYYGLFCPETTTKCLNDEFVTTLIDLWDINWWTGVVWIIVMFLSAVWTLFLTAPIHCRASIAETLMQRHISTNLMKKQTHPDLLWLEYEHIFSKCNFLVNYSFNM